MEIKDCPCCGERGSLKKASSTLEQQHGISRVLVACTNDICGLRGIDMVYHSDSEAEKTLNEAYTITRWNRRHGQ